MSSGRKPNRRSEDAGIPPAESPSDAPTLPPAAEHDSREAATVSSSPSDASFQGDGTLSEEEKTAPLGTTIRYFGDYELLEEIARGGMGVVYKARQASLNRVVALKMILAGQLASEVDVQRFHTEAEAAAKLDHPGIVPVHEVGEHAGQHYFSMGFVEGQSLADKLASGPLPPKDAAQLIKQLAEAVAYAHRQSVIHRDLKPANILLDTNGKPRITDFGLAKKMEADSHQTDTGQILGTPSFMPPEQAAGKTQEIGPAADIYALGAVLYALLTGRPPVQAANPMDTLLQVLDKEPVPPRQLDVGISRDLETICLKCLEKEPQRRYTSADELAADLERFLHGQPIQARPVGVASRTWRWCIRNPVVATLGSFLATILLILAIVGPIVAIKQQDLANEAKKKSLELEEQLHIATAQRLAAQSQSIRNDLPVRSLLLAIEGIKATRLHGEAVLPLARQALLDGLAGSGGRPLVRHEGGVSPVAISPDGRWLVTGSSDNAARLWDLTATDTAASAVVLSGHESSVQSIAISPDGRWIVTGSQDKTARLWDLTAKDPAASPIVLEGHEHWVMAVAISPDSHWVATASRDKTARLWDLTAKDPAASPIVLEGHEKSVLAVVISPDGRWVVTGSQDKTARLWDLTAKDPMASVVVLRGHTGFGSSLAITPDNRWLVTGGQDNTVRLWDLTAKEPAAVVLRGHEGPVSSVAVSPDGRWVVTGSDDATARLWDLSLDSLIEQARWRAGRDLTPEERKQYLLE